MTSDCKTHTYTCTRTLTRTYTRACTFERAAEITEKWLPDANDEQQQKEYIYTVIHIGIHKSAAEINLIAMPK